MLAQPKLRHHTPLQKQPKTTKKLVLISKEKPKLNFKSTTNATWHCEKGSHLDKLLTPVERSHGCHPPPTTTRSHKSERHSYQPRYKRASHDYNVAPNVTIQKSQTARKQKKLMAPHLDVPSSVVYHSTSSYPTSEPQISPSNDACTHETPRNSKQCPGMH